MALLDKLPIRWSLIPAIAAIGAILLVLSGLGIAIYDEQSYRTQKIREATAQGEILAATVTAALAFDDRPAAQEYVEALRVNPQVVLAGVYDDAGCGWNRLRRYSQFGADTRGVYSGYKIGSHGYLHRHCSRNRDTAYAEVDRN